MGSGAGADVAGGGGTAAAAACGVAGGGDRRQNTSVAAAASTSTATTRSARALEVEAVTGATRRDGSCAGTGVSARAPAGSAAPRAVCSAALEWIDVRADMLSVRMSDDPDAPFLIASASA
jgi:hypothetical protein